jgi:hypothetical protein
VARCFLPHRMGSGGLSKWSRSLDHYNDLRSEPGIRGLHLPVGISGDVVRLLDDL